MASETASVSHNVVLMTLDSCRFDTAELADTPHLASLGPLVRAEAAASFTLPAHWALFSGFVPRQPTGTRLVDDYDRIWRPRAARRSSWRVFATISAATVVEHYANHGARTIGLGGVEFFDPSVPTNALPALFAEFRYRGLPAHPPTGARTATIRGRPTTSDLIDSFTSSATSTEPFFAFINFSETHYPYWTARHTDWTDADDRLVRQVGEAIRNKTDTGLPGTQAAGGGELLAHLRRLQVTALEHVDTAIGTLLWRLAGTTLPTLVIAVGDHGEAFGEGGLFGHGYPVPVVMTVPLWAGLVRPHCPPAG